MPSYKARKYDECDQTYANELRKVFSSLDKTLQDNFQAFTENLMSDSHINRYCLVGAIEDFNRCGKYGQMNSNFSDLAYNFRPYQGW
jgi:hypothetical protein